jgi:hypothetical protein
MNTQEFILIQALREGNSPTSTRLILIKIGVTRGEWSARIVHVLKWV